MLKQVGINLGLPFHSKLFFQIVLLTLSLRKCFVLVDHSIFDNLDNTKLQTSTQKVPGGLRS